jgi:hypothetical protein
LWGDPDLTSVNNLQDFDTTIELYRELLGSFVRVLGNVPNVSIGEARWDQPTHDRRFGRLLIVPVGFYAAITDEPWISLPYATSTTAGVQVNATVVEDFPDGSSTSSGVIVAPP